MNHGNFHPGQRVRLSPSSPIESEGVAPRPGHLGVIEQAPADDDKRCCWAVRFEGLSLLWHIPEHLLETMDEVASRREINSTEKAAA